MGIELQIFEIAKYTLPALITGGVAFGLINKFLNNEEGKRKFELYRENRNQALPIKLQAYERLVLLLERINPINLMMRIEPNGLDAPSYGTLLIYQIQNEMEHNLAQQIYVTPDCWEVIMKAKNGIVTQIRSFSIDNNIPSGELMRNSILTELTHTESSSAIAIAFIKEELKKLM